MDIISLTVTNRRYLCHYVLYRNVSLDNITDEELSGPEVDRRTTLKLLSATGMAGLAGCTGGDGTQDTTTTGAPDTNTTSATTTTSEEETETPTSEKMGGRLKAGWFTGSVDNLDPSYITVGINAQIMANIFNGLVQVTNDLEVVGDLAKDWTVENKTAYTFNLREGVKFHNGTEFTAEDVRFTINRIMEEETPVKSKLEPLKPVDEGGVRVIDDYTVQLNFKRPYAPALATLARGDGRGSTVVCKEALEEMGSKQYKLTPVGTGPFKVAEHQVGSTIKLDAFDDYFETDADGNQLPYLDGVDISMIPEASTMVNALRGGNVDFANQLPLQNVNQVKKAQGVRVVSGPGGGWIGLGMNQKRKPFDQRKVRRGIAKAINSKQFVETAYFGNAHVAEGPIGPAHGWVFRKDKPDDQHYAPDEAKKLLKEAGAYGESFSILTMKRDLRAAKAMRQQLNRAGFDVSIEQVTTSTYWERYEKGEYDTTIGGNAIDLDPDPSLYLFFYTRGKGGVFNWVNYSNKKLNKLFDKQRKTLDREKRKQLLWQIEDIIISDAPHAYTHHEKPYMAAAKNVKGYVPHPVNRDFHTVWLSN